MVVSSGMSRCAAGLVVLAVSKDRIAFTFEGSSCQCAGDGCTWPSGGKDPSALHLGNSCRSMVRFTPLPGMEPRFLSHPARSTVAMTTLPAQIHTELLQPSLS